LYLLHSSWRLSVEMNSSIQYFFIVILILNQQAAGLGIKTLFLSFLFPTTRAGKSNPSHEWRMGVSSRENILGTSTQSHSPLLYRNSHSSPSKSESIHEKFWVSGSSVSGGSRSCSL
jgi:hypothetical protein